MHEQIKRLKNYKAPGPDDETTVLYKILNAQSRKELLKLLNIWWRGEDLPENLTHARVAPIFKKRQRGKTRKLQTYIATKHDTENLHGHPQKQN